MTALEEGRHFTTSSVSPLAMLSFGHSVAAGPQPGLAQLTHSICAMPMNGASIPEPLWAQLRSDVVKSVDALAETASSQGEQVPA